MTTVPAGVEFVHGDLRAFGDRLKRQPGKDVWLMGGGDIIASFLDVGAIDELIVSIVPVLIGEGIPLLAPRHRQVALRLREVKQFPDGVVQTHYAVEGERSSREAEA
jgi:dihydrofolate reductase